MGRNCVAAIAGFLRIPGGFSRATNAVGPCRRNPIHPERAVQRRHPVEANDSFYWRFSPLARIFMRWGAIGWGFLLFVDHRPTAKTL